MAKAKKKETRGRQTRLATCFMCGQEFYPTRSDAKTCGPTCRQVMSRNVRRELAKLKIGVPCRQCGIVCAAAGGRCVTCGGVYSPSGKAARK